MKTPDISKIYSERVEALAATYAGIQNYKSLVILEELIAVAERSQRTEDAVQRAMVLSILSGELLRRAELGVAFSRHNERQ